MFRQIKELVGDSATYGLGSLSAQLISFFLLPLYTRYLNPTDYGILALLATIGLIFLTFASLGLRTAMYNRFHAIASPEERGVMLTTALVTVFAASAILMGVGLVSAPWIAGLVTNDVGNAPLVRIAIYSAAAATVVGIMEMLMRSARQVRKVTILNTAQLFLLMALTVYLVVNRGQGVRGPLIADLLCKVLFLAVTFLSVKSFLRVGFSFDELRGMLRFGLPFVPTRLLGVSMSVFTMLLIAKMIGVAEAGLYNIATRFVQPLALAVTAFVSAWSAYKFKVRHEDKDPAGFFASVTTYFMALFLFGWVALALWGPELLVLMVPREFHAAAPLIPLVALIPISLAVNALLGTGVEMLKDTRRVPLVTLTSTTVGVAAGLALVPTIGVAGAAISAVVANGVMAFGYFRLSRHEYEISFHWRTLSYLMLSSAAIVTAGTLVRDWSIVSRSVLSVALTVLFPAVVMLVLGRSEERERLLGFFRRRRLAPSTVEAG